MQKKEPNSNIGRQNMRSQGKIPNRNIHIFPELQAQHSQSRINRTSLHPSGLTWERWEWPFPTPQERQLIAKYFKRTRTTTEKETRKKIINKVGEALL